MHNLKTNQPIISSITKFDGSMGSQLLSRGVDLNKPLASYAADVELLHSEYALAGADVISTCSFNLPKIAANDIGNLMLEDNLTSTQIVPHLTNVFSSVKLSIEIARRGCMGKYIALDLGTCGKIIEPYGDMTEAAVSAIYEAIIEYAATIGVDMILLETFYDLQEATIALNAAKHVTNIPVIVSMTLQENQRTLFDNSLKDIVSKLSSNNADCIGINCIPMDNNAVNIASQLHNLSPLPTLIMPNNGTPTVINNVTSYSMTPIQWNEFASQIRQTKINIIGGCCGTTPKHIVLL